MKGLPALLFLLCFPATTILGQRYEPNWDSIDQRPTPEWFSEARFGIFIHWGTYSVPAYAPVIPGKLAYAEWYWHAMTNGRYDPKANDLERGTWAFHQKLYGADFVYQNFAAQFKDELVDPHHWADVLASSGAKYVVLTSKHHEGFAMWPSKEASATWGRPWKENRGMGVSYGYNRAEDLSVYHTGSELVFILVDTVSRGGNLLLDIGPNADGTIPVIMEQRLKEIGDWMRINGEAIYGTKPWKNTRQWTAGEVPKIEYNKEFSSAYDVTKLIEKPSSGKASIEAFFTAKGNDIYAILPHWLGHSLVIKDLNSAKSVALLGSLSLVKFKEMKSGLAIELPDLPDDLRAQPAWVLRITLN